MQFAALLNSQKRRSGNRGHTVSIENPLLRAREAKKKILYGSRTFVIPGTQPHPFFKISCCRMEDAARPPNLPYGSKPVFL